MKSCVVIKTFKRSICQVWLHFSWPVFLDKILPKMIKMCKPITKFVAIQMHIPRFTFTCVYCRRLSTLRSAWSCSQTTVASRTGGRSPTSTLTTSSTNHQVCDQPYCSTFSFDALPLWVEYRLALARPCVVNIFLHFS